MTLALKLKRMVNGKTHTTHLKETNVSMHLDIIEKLVDRASKKGVPIELIESIWENGYNRED